MMPFQGELMICAACGLEERSDPNAKSDWRYIQLARRSGYFCPGEFPPDNSTAAEFEIAYVRALKILIRQGVQA